MRSRSKNAVEESVVFSWGPENLFPFGDKRDDIVCSCVARDNVKREHQMLRVLRDANQ